MKASGRSIAFAIAGGFLAAGTLASPATADSAQEPTAGAVTVTAHTRGDGTSRLAPRGASGRRPSSKLVAELGATGRTSPPIASTATPITITPR